jgi:hypothetical protein
MTDKELKELAKKKSEPLIFEADMSIFAHAYEQGYREGIESRFSKEQLHSAFIAGKIFERTGINIFQDILKPKDYEQKESK